MKLLARYNSGLFSTIYVVVFQWQYRQRKMIVFISVDPEKGLHTVYQTPLPLRKGIFLKEIAKVPFLGEPPDS